MTTPPDPGTSFEVDCPHCGKPFAGRLLGASERNLGFKCPHCRLFVAWKAVEEQHRAEPSPEP